MSSSVVPKFAHLTNRLWRRKHLIFIAIILVSLIITISYTVITIQMKDVYNFLLIIMFEFFYAGYQYFGLITDVTVFK